MSTFPNFRGSPGTTRGAPRAGAEGFDFDVYHRSRFSDGVCCPRCGSGRTQSWGRFGERRRFMCRGCKRTFSSFTGTPLAYLKRIDLWQGYLGCIQRRDSLRAAARELGCHVETAFLWRHRLLRALLDRDRTTLGGHVALGQVFFPYSRKGERSLDARGRRRGAGRLIMFGVVPRVWVIFATEIHEGTHDRPLLFTAVVGTRRGGLADYRRLLLPRLRVPVTIVANTGVFGNEARLAGLADAAFERARRVAGVWPPQIWALWKAFGAWVSRFRGVATRYLEHYLVWFRLESKISAFTQPFPARNVKSISPCRT